MAQSALVQELRRLWGGNIERGRKLLGLTQAGLAAALGVTQQAVSDWEAGRTAPRDMHKVAIAEVLHQDVRQLFPLTRAVA